MRKEPTKGIKAMTPRTHQALPVPPASLRTPIAALIAAPIAAQTAAQTAAIQTKPPWETSLN